MAFWRDHLFAWRAQRHPRDRLLQHPATASWTGTHTKSEGHGRQSPVMTVCARIARGLHRGRGRHRDRALRAGRHGWMLGGFRQPPRAMPLPRQAPRVRRRPATALPSRARSQRDRGCGGGARQAAGADDADLFDAGCAPSCAARDRGRARAAQVAAEGRHRSAPAGRSRGRPGPRRDRKLHFRTGPAGTVRAGRGLRARPDDAVVRTRGAGAHTRAARRSPCRLRNCGVVPRSQIPGPWDVRVRLEEGGAQTFPTAPCLLTASATACAWTARTSRSTDPSVAGSLSTY